jgi:hypothetical protein
MSRPELSETIARMRVMLASEEYASEAARRAALRSLLHESCVGMTMDEIGPALETIQSHFPDRTYEAGARAAALELQLEALQREHAAAAAELRERTAHLRGYHRLADQLYSAIQQLESSGNAILGGASAQAPRDPESLAPLFEAISRILAFAAKQERIALSVEETIGRRGNRPIDGDSLGKLLKDLLRGGATEESGEWTAPGSAKPKTTRTSKAARASSSSSLVPSANSLPLIEAKLGYLGLIPAALMAGVQQSWRGGTTSILEYLEPGACEKAVPAKLPGLRDVAILREVKRRFEEFWGDMDRNVTHYYRGTFEKVYAEKMEERG